MRKFKQILLLAFLMVIYQYWCISIIYADESSISVPFTKVSPNIDAKLNDTAWKIATQIELLWKHDGEHLEDNFHTKAQVCYDDNALYVAFLCRDANSFNLISDLSVLEQNAHVPRDDSVAIFLDIGGIDTGSYAIHINATNRSYSQWVPPPFLLDKIRNGAIPEALLPIALGYSARADWNPKGLQTATQIKKDIWIAEIKIPFEDLLISKSPTKTWKVNFVRHIPGWENIWAMWTNGGESFHQPQSFGNMNFTK